MVCRQHPRGQANYACGRGRAVLGQLDKKTRLERWRDHHAWADMQGGKWQEELHMSGEMMHGGVEIACNAGKDREPPMGNAQR